MMDYEFPSGATIEFRHLEHEKDKYNYDGSQICHLAFDQLEQFTESQFFYMLSRNRSMCGIRPTVRATCNPMPNWLKTFLAPWVDKTFDGPRAEFGEIRWFVRAVDDQGKQYTKWVPEDTLHARSLSFIFASIYDNYFLLERNPEYLANLKALSEIDQQRLLFGNWDVRAEGLVYPSFEKALVEDLPWNLAGRSVGGIDFGFHNPFAAVSGILDHDDVLWITGLRYKSNCTLPVHSEALPRGGVRWWSDPAEPGERMELVIAGHDVVPCTHMAARGAAGEKRNPKMAGIDMVNERIRTGRLKVYRRACLDLVREFGLYHYDPTKSVEEPVDEDNHSLDALRYLIVGLGRTRAVPPLVALPPKTNIRDPALWSK